MPSTSATSRAKLKPCGPTPNITNSQINPRNINATKITKPATITVSKPQQSSSGLQSKYQYSLIGSATNFRQIHRLSTKIPAHVTKLYLKYVELTPDFLSVFTSNNKNLEVIQLENIKLKQTELFKQRIILPHLRQFSLEVQDDNISDPIEWNSYVNSLNIKSLLFFDRKASDDWTIDDLYDMDIEVTFKINNVTLIKISHDDDELILNKMRGIRFQSKKHLKVKDICKLCVAHCGISNPMELPFQFLAQLILFNATVDCKVLFDHLQKCKNLTVLSIWNNNNVNRVPLDVSKHLTSPYLRRISLYNFTLTCTPPPVSKVLTAFEELVEISLYSCDWDELFVQYFRKIFPQVGKLTLASCTSSSCQLLAKAIENFDSGGCDNDNSGNGCDDGGDMINYNSNRKEVLPLFFIYLRCIDKTPTDLVHLMKIQKDFQEIENDFFDRCESFVLERPELFNVKNKPWSAKPVLEEGEDRHSLIYHQFQLFKFWNGFETYRKY